MNRLYTNGYEQFIKEQWEEGYSPLEIATRGYVRFHSELLTFLRVWNLVYIDGYREKYKDTDQIHQVMNDVDAIYIHLKDYIKQQILLGNLKGRDEI